MPAGGAGFLRSGVAVDDRREWRQGVGLPCGLPAVGLVETTNGRDSSEARRLPCVTGSLHS